MLGAFLETFHRPKRPPWPPGPWPPPLKEMRLFVLEHLHRQTNVDPVRMIRPQLTLMEVD